MHIELTELLRCPESHQADPLVLSTGEMAGRMVRTGLVGCPVCRKEYPIVKGVVYFTRGRGKAEGVRGARPTDAGTLQALLDLSGPGGYVVLLGSATRHAVGLAGLIGGIHFVGTNAPPGAEEQPVLSLLECATIIPLRPSIARGVIVGADLARAPWIAEAQRVLLRGRRLVIEDEGAALPDGVRGLGAGHGLVVGEKS